MKLLAFAASNSRHSINRALVMRAAERLAELHDNVEISSLDLNDFEMPIYSTDRQNADGIPEPAHRFRAQIGAADAVLISFAEHNGNYSVAYKNVFDWCSRIERDVYQNRPMVLLSTSPGSGGAGNVLGIAQSAMGFYGGDVKATLSVPRFGAVFDSESGQITDPETAAQLDNALRSLIA